MTDRPGRCRLACVTGRFQPLHRDHLELLRHTAASCSLLVVAITNPDPLSRTPTADSAHRHRPEANPFTFFERQLLVRAALGAAGLGPERWLAVPFALDEPATWPHYVPLEAVQFVRAFERWERTKAQWLARAGYRVELLEGDPARRRSGSAVRAAMRAGDTAWRSQVPADTVPVLERLLAARSLAAREEQG